MIIDMADLVEPEVVVPEEEAVVVVADAGAAGQSVARYLVLVDLVRLCSNVVWMKLLINLGLKS